MESASRTFVSAAGLVAACYILTVAHWTQVLLLFLGACLGWSIYSCSYSSRLKTAPQGQSHQRRQQAAANENVPAAPVAPAEVSAPVSHQAPPAAPVYRFPIHKLTGVALQQ